MVETYSFDVFDTCLTRRVAVPSEVFYRVAVRILPKMGMSASYSLVKDFVAARIQAEKVARRQSDREDITLNEIWQKLAKSMGWQYDEALIQVELEVEEELLVPISVMRQQVQAVRRQGTRIIFVSDMYLPTKFLERQLRKYGFAEDGDVVYVSGDIGKTKTSGKLFGHLLMQEKVLAGNVRHTGDNPHGDYTVPRKLGIHARLFSEVRLTKAEANVLQISHNP